ncbi:MAG: hypothetical protein KAX39_07285 [candidate division Zixibacteria bacterium]|nr:hypothetical protein [candidate division Zixibacteria bacterium]
MFKKSNMLLLNVLLIVLLTYSISWSLNPSQLIEITGTPTENGTITITIGTHSLAVNITTGMTCDQMCDAIKNAAEISNDDFWKKAKIDCLHNAYCYVRIRDGRDGHICEHVGTPTVSEEDWEVPANPDISGVSFGRKVLADAVIKLSGIRAAVPPEGNATWQATITISVNGVNRTITITVDNDITGPDAGEHPSTQEEILEAFKEAINADPDLIADVNEDNQIFVYIEGPEVKIIKYVDSTQPWLGGAPIVAHALLLAVIPDFGDLAGGQVVAIYGSYLGSNATITFGENEAIIEDYDPETGTYAVLTPPSFSIGSVDVSAVPMDASQDDYNTLYSGFTYVSSDIPTLTEWGLIIFGVVLIGFITYVFLRRRKAIAVRV